MIQNSFLRGKKLLVLAGADVHIKIVEAAKKLGVYTIVTDYLPPEESPAKQLADEYWMLDIMDIENIVSKCRENNVSGVLAYCIDPAQIPYQKICEKLNLPCYGTKEQFFTFTNKRAFKDFCRKNKVDVVPEYSLKDIESGTVKYPILIKPVDSRGSRGQTVCFDNSNVNQAIDFARKESSNGEILIERYMKNAHDMSFAYAVINSKPYLVKIGDRFIGKIEDNLDRQQISTILPSKRADEYIKNIEPNVLKMIENMNMSFGAVFLQGFYESGKVYMYDPGLRFPGSDFDLVVKKATGLDLPTTFVNYALTGDCTSLHGNPEKAWNHNGGACVIISVSVKPCVIGKIEGFDLVKSDARVFSSSLRYKEGDIIPPSGDIKQRVAEFVSYIERRENIRDFYEFVYDNFKILDENGVDVRTSMVDLELL